MAKSNKLTRYWHDALIKVHREQKCRVCGYMGDLEAAHIIGRQHDAVITGPRGGKSLYVHPDSIVPLCGAFSPEFHHGKYDARELDLLPFLTVPEQVRAVEDAGGIESARKRITGGAG